MSRNRNQYQQGNLEQVWDAVSKSYSRQNYWATPENWANLQILLMHIGDPTDKNIIEVGCGSAFTSLALAQLGAKCALLDVSSEVLKKSANEFLVIGLPEPKCYTADALHSDVPSDSFDVVWNGGVIEHFLDDGKESLVKEMLRMTKPGGKLVILVPNAWCWPFQIVQAWQKWRKTWQYGFEDDMSPRRLKRMCERIGLTNIVAYAFNPVAGWHWIPYMRSVTGRLGLDTVKYHCRRSWMGNVSVLVIKK